MPPVLFGTGLVAFFLAYGHVIEERHKKSVDSVMVTAANDRDSLEEALHLGVVDYLMKPDRFRIRWASIFHRLQHSGTLRLWIGRTLHVKYAEANHPVRCAPCWKRKDIRWNGLF